MEDNSFKKLAGVVYKDGPYEYRIYIKTGSLGDDNIVAVSLFIENIPPYVGVDLYMYAMGHIVEVAGTSIDNSDWMINKVIMEEYENLGEISTLILGNDKVRDFGLQSLSSLMNKIKINLNKKLDLEKVNSVIQIRLAKINKLISYMQKKYTSMEGFSIHINSTTSGTAKRYNDTIAPGITVQITVNVDTQDLDPNSARIKRNQIRDTIHDILKDHSPIDWHAYDYININTN